MLTEHVFTVLPARNRLAAITTLMEEHTDIIGEGSQCRFEQFDTLDRLISSERGKVEFQMQAVYALDASVSPCKTISHANEDQNTLALLFEG